MKLDIDELKLVLADRVATLGKYWFKQQMTGQVVLIEEVLYEIKQYLRKKQ